MLTLINWDSFKLKIYSGSSALAAHFMVFEIVMSTTRYVLEAT
jgi:hypothetical protein